MFFLVQNLKHLVLLFLVVLIFGCISTAQKKKQSEALRYVGEEYYRLNNYTAALNELLNAQKIYADDHLLQNVLGLTYMQKEKLSLAIKHFKKALDIKPDYAPAKNNLGAAYIANKDYDKAIACLNDVLANLLYTTPHYSNFLLGKAYYEKGDYISAEKHFRKAHVDAPKYAFAQHWLGKSLLKLNRADESVEILEELTNKYPNVPEFQYDLAQAYQLTGERAIAIDIYKKLIELNTSGPVVKKAKAELKLLLNTSNLSQ